MADVLRLVSGELDTQTDPADWVTLIAGEIVKSSVSSEALSLVAGERDMVAAPVAATIDDCCAAGEDCGTTNGGCGTCSSCKQSGYLIWILWDETGCNNSLHHICIHRKIGAGSWLEYADNLGCNSDNTVCDPPFSKACTGPSDGAYEDLVGRGGSNGTETWDFRVYIEEDGGDTVVDGPCESNAISVPTNTCLQ
jgi:hypothetical protein